MPAHNEFKALLQAGPDSKEGTPRTDLIDVEAKERFRLHLWHAFYTDTLDTASDRIAVGITNIHLFAARS